ncbi:hypothetical protein HXX01_04090 [Candidatus Nomurabacteria bacterium]|nr:hypothetical protein [Candidatus Nomurabacteria bacterium]
MKKIYIFLFLIVFLLISTRSSFAFESSGTTYQLHGGDIESGAGSTSSTSFKNEDALGQIAPGVSSGSTYNDYAGILYWLFPSASGTPSIEQLHYRWRNDDGSETSATYLASTDTSTSSIYTGDRVRLRFLLSNNGTGPSNNYNYQLEYAALSGSCDASTYNIVPAVATTEPWQMGGTSNVTDNIATTDSSGITNPGGKSFHAGKLRTTTAQSGVINITQSQFSEIEYAIKSTPNVITNQVYCFRITNIGSTTNFTYTIYPQISISGITYRPQGGGGSPSVDSSPTPSAPAGGGTTGGGSAPIDPSATPSAPAGGGGTGGGGNGDIGYLNHNNPLLAQAFTGSTANGIDLSKLINTTLKFLVFPFFLIIKK